MSICGLDIGTTGVKAVVFREDGAVLTSSYREYDLVSPRPGHLELDPHEVLTAIRTVLSEVAAGTSSDPIRSIATSSMGEAAVPVDANGKAVAGAIVGMDARGDDHVAPFVEKISRERIFDITGHGVNGCHTLFKILWRRDQDPDVFARAEKFLCFGDFTHASLGLTPLIDHSMAARTMALDVGKRDWSDEILAAAGLTRDVFAATAAPGTTVGTLGQNDLGLPNDCVVGAGLHDQPAGVLGAGIRPGESMLAGGTVVCLGVNLERVPDAGPMLANNLCYYPTAGDGYISIAYNWTGGSLLKWYRDQLAGDELSIAADKGVDPYEIICADLPDAPTGLLVLPHFAMSGTPHLDPKAAGAVLGLRLTTSRKEIVKAILEGVVYEIKINSEIYSDAGVGIELFKAIGGAARSRTWMQIAADILERPVAILSASEVAGLGAALMGARAAGILASDAEADELAAASAKVVDVLEPRPDHARRYRERFEAYREIYPATKAISHRLFALSEGEE